MSYESQLVPFRPSDATPLRFWIWFTLCAVAAALVLLPAPTFVMVAVMLSVFASSVVTARSGSERSSKVGLVIAVSLGAVVILGLLFVVLTSSQPTGRTIPGWGRAVLGVAFILVLGTELLRHLKSKRRIAAA